MEELRGYFWLIPVYERVKGSAPPRTMPQTTIPYQGKQVKGVILDESHGRPVGTIALYGEDTKYVNKDRTFSR